MLDSAISGTPPLPRYRSKPPSVAAYASKKIAGYVKTKPVQVALAAVLHPEDIFISSGFHLRASPKRYTIYQFPPTIIPILSPTYWLITVKSIPITRPIRTFFQNHCFFLKDVTLYFSSRYCSSTPVLKFAYMSIS